MHVLYFLGVTGGEETNGAQTTMWTEWRLR